MIYMLREKKGFVIVYPEYFDSTLTRSDGRKLQKSLCMPSPTIENLIHAVKKLKLEYEIEREKHYPSQAYRRRGRILVKKNGKKMEMLVAIAKAMRS